MFFNFKKMIKGFGYAFEGIKSAFAEETFKVFCLAAVVVFLMMFLLHVTLLEKVALIMTIMFVMTLELINSRIERILDFLQSDHDPKIKVIKDISAGAVLIASLGALIVGVLIFWPYLVR